MGELFRSLGRGIALGGLTTLLALAGVLLRSAVDRGAGAVGGDLVFPVPGAEGRVLEGSFEESRGDRVHEAVDIAAPRGARVVAVTAGTVARLGSGGNAGLSLDLLGADGRHCYFYAHLDELRAGLSEGARVEGGEGLGSVGTSGNAPEDAPHLHFAVRELAGTQDCWEGEPVDPAPLLRAAR